jgi:adenylate cyclase
VPAELVFRIQGRWVTIPLKGEELTIGRDPSSDVVIEHRSVSRRHARLQRDAQGWHVQDLGSRYGTTLNDLGHTNAVLRDGDKIFLHRFPLTFVDRDDAGAYLTGAGDDSAVDSPNTVFHDTVDFSSMVAQPTSLQRLQKLTAVVTESSRAVLASKSLDETFGRVLDLVFEHLPLQRGFIMLWDEEEQDLVTRSVRHKTATPGKGDIRFSRTIAERVYRDRVAVITSDARTDGRFAEGASIVELGIRSAIAAPLWHGDEVEGLICADNIESSRAFDRFDLDILSALGNQLAVAVEHERLQRSVVEQQVARRRLERYHSPAVVERITRGGGAGESLVAEEREVSVLFADIVGFTSRCEALEPREVAQLLNRYFGEMTEIVFRHEGTLDKFLGDGLMAVFGAPLAAADHPRRAVEAALDMREALARLNAPLDPAERVEFRVGIHSGRAVAGDIGSPVRRDYTVLGSTVNLAARLESEVAGPGQIVVSDVTMGRLGEGYEARPAGEHRPRGVSRPVRCFELVDRSG